MAWGPNGRRASRTAEAVLDYPEEKSSRVATINAENSALVERFRRDRANVRPYVRTSTQKLKWTHELHQCFMHAVEKLGGQDSKYLCSIRLQYEWLVKLGELRVGKLIGHNSFGSNLV